MLFVHRVRPEWRERIPAVVHVDGTARPQLVTPQSNPSYHKLISAYAKRTGIPVVINTSFNMHEEPIVCSPADAVRAFLLGNVDYLAAGPFLVSGGQRAIDVTVSVGVSSFLGQEDDAAALLKRADVALYRAKTDGRNRVVADAA